MFFSVLKRINGLAIRIKSKFHIWFVTHEFAKWKGGNIQVGFRTNGASQIYCDNNIHISEFFFASFNNQNATLHIKSGVYIGRFCTFSISEKITIEEKALLSDRVFIGDCLHGFEDSSVPIIDQQIDSHGPVIIGEGCWLGIGVTVLPGVSIGRNSVIGANSVVTKNVPDFCVAVGAPAKVIRKINKK